MEDHTEIHSPSRCQGTMPTGRCSQRSAKTFNATGLVESSAEDIRLDDVSEAQQPTEISVDSFNSTKKFDIHESSESNLLFESGICEKCRQPTSLHAFSINSYQSSTLTLRRFGAPLKTACVDLCNLCYQYCNTTCKPSWFCDWPSVLFSMLSKRDITASQSRRLCSYIPKTIRQHWFAVLEELHPAVRKIIKTEKIDKTLVVDTTVRLRRFNKLVQRNTAASIEEALDMEPCPNIRCVYGSWSFIVDNGHISFQHLLNSIFSEIISFEASFSEHLRGMSPTYFEPSCALNTFIVAASCRVDDVFGLVLHTCVEHNRGSHLQVIHPPLHPILKHSSCVHGERLAAVVPTISSVTNTKANYASHTYQLIRSVGSFSGICSIRLTNKRKWDVTCNLLRHSEGYATYFRDDIKLLIRK